MNATNKLLQLGTKIYYTGDMANQSAFLTVVEVLTTPDGSAYYNLQNDETGGVWKAVYDQHIGRTYNGTCAVRFVTMDAYHAHGNAVVERLRSASFMREHFAFVSVR